ncbi:PAS domain-containing protein [Chloroflexota bacterium]
MEKEMTENLAGTLPRRTGDVWRNSHLWYIVILMIACSILIYLDFILDFMNLSSPGWHVFLTTHELYLFLFSIPLLYAAYVFGLRGILIGGVTVILLNSVPDIMLIGYQPQQLLMEVSFIAFVSIIGILIAHVQNRRTQAEESERKYRLLADNVSDVIWTLDMNLRYTYVSPSVMRLRGYSAEETIAQTLDKVLTPTSLEIATRVFKEELAIESMEQKDLSRSRTLELEQKCKDGSTIWTELTVSFLRNPDGQAIGVLGITRDITERRCREDLGQAMIRSAKTGIYIVQDRQFIAISPLFEELSGYTAEDLIGTYPLDYVHVEDKELVRIKAIGNLKGQCLTPYEYRFAKKNGDILWILERVASTEYRGRQAAVGSFMDITQYRKAKEEIACTALWLEREG